MRVSFLLLSGVRMSFGATGGDGRRVRRYVRSPAVWTRRGGWRRVVRSRGGRWGAGAGVGAAGWVVTPTPVAVYDGLGQPDESYRYVTVPVGVPPTAPPTDAKATAKVSGGVNREALNLFSAEVGPQVVVVLPAGSVSTAAGPVTVTASPQAPTEQPSAATIDGNVYQLTLTGPSVPITVTGGGGATTIYLRATSPRQPGPVMELRSGPGQPWQALQTSQVGGDVYAAALSSAGQYALALPHPVAPNGTTVAAPSSPGGVGVPLGVVVLIGVLVLLAAIVIIVRRRSSSVDARGPRQRHTRNGGARRPGTERPRRGRR